MERKVLFYLLVVYKDSSHDLFVDYAPNEASFISAFYDSQSPEYLSLIDKIFVDKVRFLDLNL